MTLCKLNKIKTINRTNSFQYQNNFKYQDKLTLILAYKFALMTSSINKSKSSNPHFNLSLLISIKYSLSSTSWGMCSCQEMDKKYKSLYIFPSMIIIYSTSNILLSAFSLIQTWKSLINYNLPFIIAKIKIYSILKSTSSQIISSII